MFAVHNARVVSAQRIFRKANRHRNTLYACFRKCSHAMSALVSDNTHCLIVHGEIRRLRFTRERVNIEIARLVVNLTAARLIDSRCFYKVRGVDPCRISLRIARVSCSVAVDEVCYAIRRPRRRFVCAIDVYHAVRERETNIGVSRGLLVRREFDLIFKPRDIESVARIVKSHLHAVIAQYVADSLVQLVRIISVSKVIAVKQAYRIKILRGFAYHVVLCSDFPILLKHIAERRTFGIINKRAPFEYLIRLLLRNFYVEEIAAVRRSVDEDRFCDVEIRLVNIVPVTPRGFLTRGKVKARAKLIVAFPYTSSVKGEKSVWRSVISNSQLSLFINNLAVLEILSLLLRKPCACAVGIG